MRPRILARRDEFLVPLKEHRPNADATRLSLASDIKLGDVGSTLDRLGLDGTVGPVARFRGGARAARERLCDFLGHRFQGYAERRSEPVARACSELSPYLHFGQISPIEVALAARAASRAGNDDKAAFLEELVVRRELAANFAHYTDDYDRFDCLPAWAVATLEAHAADRREHVYGLDALEGGRTHDSYWNAAMREMRATGYMHNYMRMYWAKKIIEWTADPREAYATVLHLNNKLFLDGRDFNSFANVGWCFGLHDRPWPERPIFGKVRYMNAKGLERKFDIVAYVRWTETL